MTDQQAALGVDIGGTFTDFFAFEGGTVRAWKRLSTADPADAVIEGMGDASTYARIVHGSTVATNALLERRGPRTVLVTTKGFKDLLEIRRQVRDDLYALEPVRTPHVVARGDAIEVDERLAADGSTVIPLVDAEVARVVETMRALEPDAVAVCLLFGYRNPEHEQRLGDALRAAGFDVSLSHEVLPEHREYERASTTAIDAFLRPTVRGYLARIEAHTEALRVMHSGAGITTAAAAGERPTAMVLSGPAGGVLGAVAVAGAAGIGDIVTFDMGGTSTDVALCTGGQPHLRNSAMVDGMALHAPMVDIETVGAGGGSIAWLDEGGALRVGPRSAGADPGPASYGRGGVEPTVSDANVVLGRLRPERFLGGGMALDADAAHRALARLGEPGQAARAVIEVVNANMARALRAVSLERGFDPAAFALVAFGGAGPLHACELAAQVGMPRVLIPRYPGVLSALGMVTAAEALERSQGLLLSLDGETAEMLASAASVLEAEVREAADAAGTGTATIDWIADARYRGQAHELRVGIAVPKPEAIVAAFHDAHRDRFGYHLADGTVELVTLRARVTAEAPPFPLTPQPVTPDDTQPDGTVEVVFGESDVPVQAARFERTSLGAGARITGPAIITQDDATTVVPPGWCGEVDALLNLLLERADGD